MDGVEELRRGDNVCLSITLPIVGEELYAF